MVLLPNTLQQGTRKILLRRKWVWGGVCKKKQFPIEKELRENILGTTAAPLRQRGTEKDLIALWKWQYKQRKWNTFAGFKQTGGLNYPYILFKAKNVTNKDVREQKIFKVRPIAPGTRHPMKPLLHLVGRAWHFVSKHMPEENFIINHGKEVPDFLKAAQQQLSTRGGIEVRVRDIDSCYPNMPKEEILEALKDTTTKLHKKLGVDGVWVPKRSKLQPCTWTRGIQRRTLCLYLSKRW